MADTVTGGEYKLSIVGRRIEKSLPSLLRGAVPGRGQGASDQDVFLPPDYLKVEDAFDVSQAARSGVPYDDGTNVPPTAKAGSVIILELADGGTLITSGERLHDALAQSNPDLVKGNSILLEKLRVQSATPSRTFGAAIRGVISKIYVLSTAPRDHILDMAISALNGEATGLGVSAAGTRILMKAIEDRLPEPGLYQWENTPGKPDHLVKAHPELAGDRMRKDPAANRFLVFVHGTASSTIGSFGNLRADDAALWDTIYHTYGGRVYGFEHRTLSVSPIENAIMLANELPRGAHVSLVSHSRGGLVCDLLCLKEFDALIGSYAYDLPQAGQRDSAGEIRNELTQVYEDQRKQLAELAKLLRERELVIDRYVRTACPANGTLLASGNLDVFLASVLTLVGAVPFFFGSIYYAAFKRIVIEIAKYRTDPHMVPGIEAMLPDSPLVKLLSRAQVQAGITMAVIAGDVEGGNMLSRVGVLLTDFLLFDQEDNDLVVNTAAMLAGIASRAKAHVLFDRGAHVSHFRYFTNGDTRRALRDWLVAEKPAQLPSFIELPHHKDEEEVKRATAQNRNVGTQLPVVVVLPGTMGTHLISNRDGHLWFKESIVARGELERIKWGEEGVEAQELFDMTYGPVCAHLASTHRVERFPYDWRAPLEDLGRRLWEFLAKLQDDTTEPIRLLAHSMGGLVVRACLHLYPDQMKQLMAREGARLIMLGTPNQGTHAMVENLIGKGDAVRTLARFAKDPELQKVLDMMAEFPGALQLLPKPGFSDTFAGAVNGGQEYDYRDTATWQHFRAHVRDAWFGDGRCAVPTRDDLKIGSWLWEQDGTNLPALPSFCEKKSIYVFGMARNTVCGVRQDGPDRTGRIRLVGTTRGDGIVTWDSGRIGGIGRFYYMPVQHGDLLSSDYHFETLTELLVSGATMRLSEQAPAASSAGDVTPVLYDAAPPMVNDADAVLRVVTGRALRNRVPPRTRSTLEVAVKAMDLRFLAKPIMVGHYEQDPIAGPEEVIDRELLATDLSKRHALGLYAGQRGSSTVVLRSSAENQHGGGLLTGAVVVGLGRYEGILSAGELSEAIHTGALRYLLQVADVLGKEDREVPLASLLIGYNSSANLSIAASVEALVRGVIQANARFHETTGLNIRIASLDIVELYIDTAITAVYALRQMFKRMETLAGNHRMSLNICEELLSGEGMRHRLENDAFSGYWPRLVVVNAEQEEASASANNRRADDPAEEPMIAERLRFMYVGARARAEAVVHQRQPSLVESLVRQQIGTPIWDRNFGRMLFQLMVPHDFKDAARLLDRVVLVVDSQTANLPWEMMLADSGEASGSEQDKDKEVPMAIKAEMVRQLSTTHFRPQVLQATQKTALVIGNPSVAGFSAAFPDSGIKDVAELEGARDEALAVHDMLKNKIGYDAVPIIGMKKDDPDAAAGKVLSLLYSKPWRLLHICGHGAFDLRHFDKRRRSGALLSDGLLITATEIAAMEVVPDLVFFNCCHLGKINIGYDRNKLASSIARELIDIGVRCVVVAGWAVTDDKARLFAEAFYRELLIRRRPFGRAVFEARRTIWELSQQDITWGAYQAYGDPTWMPDANARDLQPANTDEVKRFAAIEEVLDDLGRTRVRLSHQRDADRDHDTYALAERVDMSIKLCPPHWRELPRVRSALGLTRRELNQLKLARQAFIEAIAHDDGRGDVPIRDIELLIDTEAMLSERCMEDALRAGDTGLRAESIKMSEAAIKRLDGLDKLISDEDMSSTPGSRTSAGAKSESGVTPLLRGGRNALRGRILRSKASLYAREIREGVDTHNQNVMLDLLDKAIAAWIEAEGVPGSGYFVADLCLNRLALDSLTEWHDPRDRDAAVALARYCSQSTEQHGSDSVAGVLIHPRAQLVEHLLLGTFKEPGDKGELAVEDIVDTYLDATSNITLRPTEINDITRDIEAIALFYEAINVQPAASPGSGNNAAAHLRTIIQRLQMRRGPPQSTSTIHTRADHKEAFTVPDPLVPEDGLSLNGTAARPPDSARPPLSQNGISN